MAEVEHLADRCRLDCGEQHGVDHVVDVETVAQLRTLAEQFDVLAGERAANEHREEAETVTVQVLAGPIDVRETEGRGPHVVRVGVHAMELFAGELVDAVHVDRPCGVQFVDGQVLRAAVHLACRGLHDHGVRRGPP